MQGTVYLLHFERPICPTRPCQHYLGYTIDLDARLAEHRAGRGARLTQVAVERGIAFEVVRTWAGDRTFERRLKHRKESPRLCPVCFPLVRRRPTIEAVQLELPLLDDFPELPYRPMDSYEFLVTRSMRRASAARLAELAVGAGEEWDEGLL